MRLDSWENIYEKGQQINRYPYGELVSVFFNSLKYFQTLKSPSETKVLEVGCGAGNNLWFFAENDFRVFGVDGSKKAVKIAKEYLKHRGVEGNISHGFFDNLPYQDNSMDIIIDRESLYCGTIEDIKSYLEEIRRVLRSGGIFISFRFSDKSPVLLMLREGSIQGTQLDECTWTDLSAGYDGTGVINFLRLEDIETQYYFLERKMISEHRNIKLSGDDTEIGSVYSEYIIVGINRG